MTAIIITTIICVTLIILSALNKKGDTKGTVFNYIRKFQIKKYMYRRNDLSINVL